MNDSLCRYWMLVSGAERGALTIAAPLSDMHHGLPAIVVATKGQSVLNDYLLHHADDLQLAQAVRSELLAPDSHVVHTLKSTASTTKGAAGVGGPGRVIVCVGATPRASLYAVYSLMELLGVRYYLHGDVLPSQPNATSDVCQHCTAVRNVHPSVFCARPSTISRLSNGPRLLAAQRLACTALHPTGGVVLPREILMGGETALR